MTQTRRERLRETTLSEIHRVAWEQIAEQGAPSLSLRAIARAMGLTAPALYRYYPSRDHLVTALVIDAFDSFSQNLEQARDGVPAVDHLGRFRRVCHAYFHWAVAEPERYALIFGSPVPGYRMTEAAMPYAQRSFLAVQTVLGQALAAGALSRKHVTASIPANLLSRYEYLRSLGMPYDPAATHLALTAWNALHGLTSLYLAGYLGSFLGGQAEDFVGSQVERLVICFGFETH